MQDLLLKFGLMDASPTPTPTPMVSGKQFLANDGQLMANPTVYRKLLGALQYVTNTRPDVNFAVNRLSRYMHSPTVVHWQAAKNTEIS